MRGHFSLGSAARRVQRSLEAFYELESGPDVADYVHATGDGGRETLLVQHAEDAIELRLLLPPSAAAAERGANDAFLQLVEGVSHFVYVAERARVELPATELELELQAEVDKLVVLAFDGETLSTERVRDARDALYDRVHFLHDAGTERGTRYRMANGLAARLSHRLAVAHEPGARRAFLRRFYRAGQGDKIRLATAS